MWAWLKTGLFGFFAGICTTVPNTNTIEGAVEEGRKTRGTAAWIGATSLYEFYGRHLLANYTGCDASALRDVPRLRIAFERAIRQSGATPLEVVTHVFPSDGVTLVYLLAESHASIHTYPEHAACFIDLFTCGRTCSAEQFDDVMRAYLKPHGGSRHIITRDQEICREPSCNV